MNWRWKVAQAAEIRWWRMYLHRKKPEAYLRSKRQYWERVLKKLEVEVPPAARVLDAGCGPAGVFMVMPQCHVDAVDPLLGQYKTHLPHFNPEAYPWVRFCQTAIEEMDRKEVYDYVFCLNAINHVADLNRSLQRLFVAGRPGSRLILTVDGHNNRFFRHLLSRVPGDILHPHQYYLCEYLGNVEKAGWEIESTHLLKKGFIFSYYAIVARHPGLEKGPSM